jgi:hypothetical protein
MTGDDAEEAIADYRDRAWENSAPHTEDRIDCVLVDMPEGAFKSAHVGHVFETPGSRGIDRQAGQENMDDIIDDLSGCGGADALVIATPAGRLEIEPGTALHASAAGASWHMPLTLEELTAFDLLYYCVHSDGQKVFIGGLHVLVALTIDFGRHIGAKIPLRRSHIKKDWDPGGMEHMKAYPLSDSGLLVIYESGIVRFDAQWDVLWDHQLGWVHVGFYLDRVDAAEGIAWMTSEWGAIGYRLADGTVLDPEGYYAWRLSHPG